VAACMEKTICMPSLHLIIFILFSLLFILVEGPFYQSPNQFPISQSLGGGNGPRDESVGQDKTEATSENNAAGNHSSGEMASIQRSKEQAVKRSDSQVSTLHISDST